jgi:carbon starvation protein
MSLVLVLFSSFAVLVIAFRFYGAFLRRRFEIADDIVPPSESMSDGVDFVPTSPFVVLGHHFSSIAGAGPIVGPVLAGLYFGWLPSLLWILIGSIFIGGVHDFGSLIASMRHKAGSIADVARNYMGRAAGRLFMLFILLALVYVIVVFLDLTAGTFAKEGNVASSSMMFMGLAVALGLVLRRAGGFPMWAVLSVFVPLLFLAVVLGEKYPIAAAPTLFGSTKFFWSAILLGYCFIASVIPVWLLLQPRDFLSSFLLYGAIIGAGVGLLIGAVRPDIHLAIQWPALVGKGELEAFGIAPIGYLFPVLFITIACGACSGFHSLVSSGTTARQVKSESDAFRVGYGAMLIEGFVAVIALMTVAFLVFRKESFGSPIDVFANGVGQFLASMGLPTSTGTHFAYLAISTFLLTTLDTCTRLTRYLVQDALGMDNRRAANRYLATAIAIGLPAVLAFVEFKDAAGNPVPLWKAIWPIFGASNQLLAGLALLAVTVWLKRVGRRYLFVAVPMVFMLAVTMTALGFMVYEHSSWKLGPDAPPLDMIGGIGAALFVLGCLIAATAAKAFGLAPLNCESVTRVRG